MKRIITSIIAAVICLAVGAQGICTINGHIADNQLADGTKLKKVYLTRTNELGQTTTVATAKVKRGSYALKYELAQDEPVMQYTLTGFGEGKGIALFIEPGEVTVSTASAMQPEQSTVTGTPTNDTYAEYRTIRSSGEAKVAEQLAALAAKHGAAWLDTSEGKREAKRIRGIETIRTESEVMRFFIEHNASPMTPLEVERTLLPKLSAAYAEQITKAMDVSLHHHPYYHSLRNQMLASTLKVGSEAPDIALHLLGGEAKRLSDYRGKYVLLNFWAPDCEKSPEMLAELKSLYNMVKASDEYLILSISLDTDAAAWQEGIKAHGIDLEGWLHASDHVGTASPAARLLGADSTPKIVFIEPEGRAVSLDMETNEVIMRIEQIMMGDLYYLDQKE